MLGQGPDKSKLGTLVEKFIQKNLYVVDVVDVVETYSIYKKK